MTTIAWDGETLAADSGRFFGSMAMPGEVLKVAVVAEYTGYVYVFGCGSLDLIKTFQNYVEDQDAEWPDVLTTYHEEVELYTVNREGELQFWCRGSAMPPISLPHAIGSGAEYALGALAAGVSVCEAVRIAGRYDAYTSEDTKVYHLVNTLSEGGPRAE